MELILEWLSSLIISAIENTGYFGIAALMAFESANIPIPSEIIMPFSGYLAFQGVFNFFWVVFWGAFGNLVGSLASYYLGFFGGRPILEKYGKFLLIHGHDLDLADAWFKKYGPITAFVSRLLPVMRTFVSFPAGVARMNIWKFSVYTFAGSFIWSYFLVYIGVVTGENWTHLGVYFRKFDWAVGLIVVAGIAWWVWRHVKTMRHTNP